MTLYEKVYAERFGQVLTMRRGKRVMPDLDPYSDAAETLRAYFAGEITRDEAAGRLYLAGVEHVELVRPGDTDEGGRTPR